MAEVASALRKPRESRCNPSKDTVTTAAGQDAYICLDYARGTCQAGRACTQLHRLPTQADEARCQELQVDCFGRQAPAGSRAAAHTRENCTLYVNYRGAGSYGLPQIRKLLEDNFNAWGPCVNISIKHHLTIAFVTYEWRCTAEFAREAMEGQKLLGSTQAEVLMLRWSTGAGAEGGGRAAGKRGKDQGPGGVGHYVGADWESLTEAERSKAVEGLQMEAALKRQHVVSYYPNTDHQYASEQQGSQAGSTRGYDGPRGLPATGYTSSLASTQRQQQPTGYGSRVAGSAGAGPRVAAGTGGVAVQGSVAVQGGEAGVAVTSKRNEEQSWSERQYPREEGWEMGDDGHHYYVGLPQGGYGGREEEGYNEVAQGQGQGSEAQDVQGEASSAGDKGPDGLALLGGYASGSGEES